jgi:hypothetical protein
MDIMSEATGSIQSPQRLRELALVALVPFFTDGSTNDVKAARLMAEGSLDEYNAATPKELQLATQIIAFGWAVLACLRAGSAATSVSVKEMMYWQDVAMALNRALMKATKALDARRKERAKNPKAMTPENTKWDEGAFQLAINQALEKLNAANAKFAVYMPELAPVVQTPKLDFLFAEPMTPSVLARRARH